MRNFFLLIISCLLLNGLFITRANATEYAADLIEVYQQAQASDPVFQQAIAQRLSTKEGVPINLSALLPNVSVTADPSVTRSGFSGTNLRTTSETFLPAKNITVRAYTLTLTATQTVFNFAQFAALANAMATSKQADATLNAALQNLMIRVANAYFAILRDEENLSYNGAAKESFASQLDQVKQQYEVGLKTITDVYTAQASYDSAVASYIAAETTLSNDKENLRVITGKYYPHLAQLSEAFPLISPQPTNMEKWVEIALRQNWTIKSSQYNTDAARITIKQQFGGHLPTVNLQATSDRQYSYVIDKYHPIKAFNGPAVEMDRIVQVNLNLPVFAGGNVVAQTNQAIHNYEVAQQQLEQTTRQTTNQTRQSYQSVIAGISQIQADKQAIKSNNSALEGMEASYQVGTEILVNVLDQRQKLFQAQTQYATDRYNYINNLLSLKQAAGTLSFNDLYAINHWLEDRKIAHSAHLSSAHRYTPNKSRRPSRPLYKL